ncbi:bifunctional folylpolyglutamate synthase/dihydrofolate synthase [Collinsella sp. zg1085]|uniref:bifunctional folylpolyglutamate synthase/dihydrofolate synthase n=1 Tax=Collinsella sp. zg1085 TaxID=2844380 RepID=UPI001C0C4463|nr:Mur ligase family protein [Collinsella sp. zg1085]QWT18211.1 bifunctional folylpolyglutamate synthase/dihydrofolate synthase [Collinsella sp. zg1085]
MSQHTAQLNQYSVPFVVPELSYQDACAISQDTGSIPGITGPLLETVVDMLDELARPDAHMDVIQIAGTNGKSSTTRFCAAMLMGEGYNTALYTSPHLVEYPERMELNGQIVSQDMYAHGVSAAAEAGRRVNERRNTQGLAPYIITPFDLLTVAALVIFAEAQMDVCVLEVGLGGRWDATSATNPSLVAITGIGYDHMHILGNTLAEITAEKAAIIKPGRTVILGAGTQLPEVRSVIEEQCEQAGVTPLYPHHELLHAPGYLGDSLKLNVQGIYQSYTVEATKPVYQAQNIALAVALTEAYVGHALQEGHIRVALQQCPTPGRFDIVQHEPLILIDACHNPQSCAHFVQALDELSPDVNKRPTLLIAALSDKDVEGIVDVLSAAFPRFAVTQTTSARSLPAQDLAERLRAHLCQQGRNEVEIECFTHVGEALSSYRERGLALVAAGTITLAGEVSRELRSQAFTR